MTSRKAIPWYQNFQIMAYVVAGLAALGTAVAVASKYINLPAQVEAGEQKNVQQDKQIDRLITLQEYYQQQQQAPNQAAPRPHGLREWDEQGICWDCPLDDWQACYASNLWRTCD